MAAIARVLIVEDDAFTRSLFAAYMEREGYAVSLAANGREMLERLESQNHDLVLLDLMLPDEDGLVLARKIRARWTVPIIVITVRQERDYRLTALGMGADDYLTKPVDPAELVLRARNVLNRTGGLRADQADESITFHGWRLDLTAQALYAPDGTEVGLQPAEFRVLAALARASGRVLSRAKLLDATARRDGASERMIDVFVSNIRKKIEVDPRNPLLLRTVRSAGYRLTLSNQAKPAAS
jgi:two-component system, OmpR family, response regulator